MRRLLSPCCLLLAMTMAHAAPLVSRVVYRDLALGQTTISHNSRSVTITRTAIAPVIDGTLDDACWQAAKPLTPFLRTDQDHPALAPTSVRLLYDDRKLYLAFRCDEPAAGELRADHMVRDSDIWRDDDVEVFLCPNDDHYSYYQAMVNSRGGLGDARYGGAMGTQDNSWNAPWEIKTEVGADYYAAEMAVPFSALGLPGAIDGSRWCGNFCRTRYAGAREDFCWSRPGFHSTSGFGELVFGQAPVMARLNSVGNLTWGRNAAGVEVQNGTGAPVKLRAEAVIDGQEALVHQPQAAPAGTGQVEVAYRVPQAGVAQMLQLRLYEPGGQPVLWVERPFQPPPLLAFSLGESRLWVGETRLLAKALISLPAEELKGLKLRVKLLDAAGKVLGASDLKQSGGGEMHFLLDLPRLAAGAHRVAVELLGAAGEQIEEQGAPLAVLSGPF